MNVLVVGGGASGISAALSLTDLYPEAQVTLWEANGRLGGMADSIQDANGEWINYGVQGVHESFEYTLRLIAWAQIVNPDIISPMPVALTSQFVTPYGVWNTSTSVFSHYWRKFRGMCQEAQQHPDVYSLMTIVDACKTYFIPDSFIDGTILPLLALFFGTGNQIANLPAALGAQVFYVQGATEYNLTLFDLDDTGLITRSNMRVLPPLKLVYEALHYLLDRRNVRVELNMPVTGIMETVNGIVVNDSLFDAVILAVQVPDALRILPVTHRAVDVLKHAKYYVDTTFTHRDWRHMGRVFEMSNRERFNYYIRSYARNDMLMGFHVNNYQTWLSTNVFQTIFLDGGNTDDIPTDLIHKAVWHQIGTDVEHMLKCILKMKTIQGPRLFFAGSYTLINSHEVAIMSGIYAAQLLSGTSGFPVRTFGPINTVFKKYMQINK